MAGNSLALAWDLIARDGASPAFLKVSASADKAAASTERAAASTEAAATRMSGAAKLLAVGGVAAIAAFAAESVKMASRFQSQMLLVQTQAGASAAEIRKMTPAVLSLSGKVAQAPEALATSLYHVESTGLRGKAALDAVKVAAEGASISHADLEETTNALTATIASGMLPATESYSQAMGQLNTIVGSGDMKLSDLNQALGTGLLVTVKQYGITLNDVGAALADFGDNNIRGADAATALRMAVQSIAKPGVGAASALGQIGLSVEQLQSDEQTGGLNKALKDLHGHLVSSGIDASKWGTILTDAFTKKAGTGILTLVGTFDRFEQKYKEVSGGADTFGKAWAATTKSAAFQAAALKDNVEQLTISVGNGLMPVVTTGLTWINQTGIPAIEHLGSAAGAAAGWFGDLPKPIRDTALALGALGLAKVVGLTDVLGAGLSKVGGAFTATRDAVAGFGDEMAVQQALASMEARSLGEVDLALGGLGGGLKTVAGELSNVQLMMAGWDGELAAMSAEEDVAAASTGRFAAALGTLKARVGGALGAESGTLAGAFGPIALAVGGSIFAIKELNDLIVHDYDPSLKIAADDANNLAGAQKAFTAALQESNGVIDQNVRLAAAKAAQDAGVLTIAQKAGVALPQVTSGLLDNKTAYNATKEALQNYYYAMLINTSDGTKASKAQAQKAKDALDAFVRLGGQLPKTAAQQAQLAAATGKADDASKKASDSLALFGSTAGMTKDQITAAQKAIAAQQKQLEQDAASFVDPLKTYQEMAQAMAQKVAESTKNAKDSWSDYVSSVKVDLNAYAANLEKQLKDQEQWKQNLVIIASRAGADVAQQFADMGVQGAGLTAQMATATGKNFDRMAADMRAKAAAGAAGAATDIQEGMAVAAAKGALGAKATVQAIATQLGLGLEEVRRIAAEFAIKLTEGLNPFLDAVGHPIIGTPTGNRIQAAFGQHWSGGYTGNGGKYEPKGIVHGGEFVLTKEQTAKAGVNNLYTLASMLSGYSGGGYVSPSDVPHPPSLTPPFQAPVSTAGNATMSREYDAARQILSAFAVAVGGGTTSIPGGRAAIAAQVQALAALRGWGSGAEWQALVSVINRESGFNPNAANPTSSARGLFQKMTSIQGPVESTVTGQTNWGLGYIGGRYGDPIAAWRHEQQFGWYDGGGWLMPGMTMALNTTGKPERIRTAQQEAALGGPMQITGRLALEADGFVRLIDGRIVSQNRRTGIDGRSL